MLGVLVVPGLCLLRGYYPESCARPPQPGPVRARPGASSQPCLVTCSVGVGRQQRRRLDRGRQSRSASVGLPQHRCGKPRARPGGRRGHRQNRGRHWRGNRPGEIAGVDWDLRATNSLGRGVALRVYRCLGRGRDPLEERRPVQRPVRRWVRGGALTRPSPVVLRHGVSLGGDDVAVQEHEGIYIDASEVVSVRFEHIEGAA